MPRSRRISLGSSILLLASCGGDSTQPSNPPDPNELPPLESVDYDRLGRGKLAFQRVTFGTASSQGYYVVDADARTSTASLGGEAISAPALSPDGRRVTYTQAVDVATGLDVFVSNLDGTSKQRVANFAGHEGPPTWTPDGSQIVFLGRETQGGDESSVYRQSPVANPSDRTRVAVATIFVAGSPPCTLVNVVDDGFIAVSSEGRFTFSCASSGVYVMDQDGRNVTAVAPVGARTADTGYEVYARAWSPDGRRVAYLEARRAVPTSVVDTVSVRVVDVAQRTVTTLAEVPGTGLGNLGGANGTTFSLCWSPVGGWLAFSVPDGQLRSHIHVVDADGMRLVRLTTDPNAYDLAVSCAR